MALIEAADVSARVSAEDYLKLFDNTGAGTVNATFLAATLATACSEVAMATAAAFGGVALDADGGTADEALKAFAVYTAIKHALFGNPLCGEGDAAPYAAAIKWADAFIERAAKDSRARPVTSVVGRARPRASVLNTQDAAGDYTNPFVRAADKKDPSGF